MQKQQLIWVAAALLILLLGFSFFNNSQNTITTLPSISPSPKMESKLEDKLYLLSKAENPQQFARQYGITLKESTVQVKVELNNPTYQLPKDFGIETGRSGNMLEAWIKIDHLQKLSEQPEIKSIQLPIQAIPLGN